MNLNLSRREFNIGEGYNYSVVLLQNEIERIINILEQANSSNLAEKFKMVIFIRDYNENTISLLNESPYRGDLRKVIMSPLDYNYYLSAQREFRKKMEDYYHGKKSVKRNL